MKKLLTLFIVLSTLLLISVVRSQSQQFSDYQKGLDAYHRGDYAAALREWELLAEQGHVDDISPRWLSQGLVLDEATYKDLDWLKRETEQLVKQLAE